MFFANERTFISWLHMAVMMSSISVGVLAFSGSNCKFAVSSILQHFTIIFFYFAYIMKLYVARAQDFAAMMLPISLIFIFYALRTYLIRSSKIKTRDADR
ncbi:DUF202 domain-containing protein [archaeon]|nr:MAG: DUF202 domain-containing protein [archaeon]